MQNRNKNTYMGWQFHIFLIAGVLPVEIWHSWDSCQTECKVILFDNP